MRSRCHPGVRMAGSLKIRVLRLEVRPQSAAAKRRELLEIKVKALFEANNEEYGYRRMRAALARGGGQCSPGLVRSVMRELGPGPASRGRGGTR